MLDTHCHVDLYPDPTKIAQAADHAGVGTIVVTNLPSAYERSAPHVRQFKRLRLALGLHPLVANQHTKEREAFLRLAPETFYIGEVGLDFSPQGYATREIQIESFKFVLTSIRESPKFVTLHSRRAESQVLEILQENYSSPVVFHWYSGTVKILKRILDEGHYVSVNPAMIASSNGRTIIKELPPERVLTETDGPFVKVGNRVATPMDVALVEKFLSQQWRISPRDAAIQIQDNFSYLLRSIKGPRGD